MRNPVIHWEIGGHEGEKLAWFYGELFGWTPQPAGEGYWLVPPRPPGIGGGLLQTEEPVPPHVTIYVQVGDLEATLDHAALLGGKIVRAPNRSRASAVSRSSRTSTATSSGCSRPHEERASDRRPARG